MKQIPLLLAAATLVLTPRAHAENFTGGIAIGGAGSYSSTSLTFGSTNVFEGGGTSGTFAGLSFGLVPVSNTAISGLSGTSTDILSAPLPIFELTSTTTPADEYAFEIASITPESSSGGAYSGTGLFVDNQNVLATTAASFQLSFSGPASYSFSADVADVPEPSSRTLLLLLAAAFHLRRRFLGA